MKIIVKKQMRSQYTGKLYKQPYYAQFKRGCFIFSGSQGYGETKGKAIQALKNSVKKQIYKNIKEAKNEIAEKTKFINKLNRYKKMF